jgi:hypothetical protein
MVDEVAYRRFLANGPVAEREIRCIELYHSAFSSVQRFVQDLVDQNLTLEATAPRDPSATVLFTAISMSIKEPFEEANTDPVLAVTLGAVGNEVQDQINGFDADDYMEPVQFIYRKYYSGDLSEPVMVLNLDVTGLSFNGYTQVQFSAEDIDLTNKRSGRVYTLEDFPSLEGV